MDYLRIHDNIINAAKNRIPPKRFERHHIIPKSFGGNNDSSNIVKLTLREHYIIHKILVKINDGYKKFQMICALMRFVHAGNVLITSHDYERFRIAFCLEQSKHHTGRKVSPDTKLKMSAAQKKRYKNKPTHWNGREHSHDTKLKMSDAQRGENNPQYNKPRTCEEKAKISNSMKGKNKSPETVAKFKARTMSEAEREKISQSLREYHARRKLEQSTKVES